MARPRKATGEVLRRTTLIKKGDPIERLTLTLSRSDLDALNEVSGKSLRSMSAQAIYFIRLGVAAFNEREAMERNDVIDGMQRATAHVGPVEPRRSRQNGDASGADGCQ